MTNEEEIELIETKATLAFFSENCSAEELKDLLKMNPDRSWNIGDLIATARGERPDLFETQANKIFFSSKSDSLDLQEHLSNLLQQFENKSVELEKVIRTGADISLAVTIFSEKEPRLNFSREVIQKLADMIVDIDIDLYILGEDDSD